MTNPGSITTHEITELMAELKLKSGKFCFFESQAAFRKNVKAPRSTCVLNTNKLKMAGIQMRPIHEAIRSSLEAYATLAVSPSR
jgi:3,5-epimerase/4-reductase